MRGPFLAAVVIHVLFLSAFRISFPRTFAYQQAVCVYLGTFLPVVAVKEKGMPNSQAEFLYWDQKRGPLKPVYATFLKKP